MSKLRSSFATIKSLASANLRFLLLALLSIGIGGVTVTSMKLAPSASAANSKSMQAATHKLVAAYYSVKGNTQAMLMLSNQGPLQLPVRISLFNRTGAKVDLPAFTLVGNEVRSIDLRQAVPTGPSFEEGSVQVDYDGRTLELGGLVVLMNPAQSLVFEEELVEPAKAFASSKLEGVWWRPTGSTEVLLAVSNNSGATVSATIQTRGEGQGNTNSRTIQLAARETRVLTTEDHNGNNELELHGTKGGISISHTSAPGAVVAHGLIQEPDKGFSNVIELTDQQRAKLNRLDGVGLRFGSVSGQQLKQVVVLRNVGDAPTTVSGRIPHTLSNGNQAVATIQNIQLAAGEVKEVNLPSIPSVHQISVAGIEFTYTGNPGSVMATALSYSSDRNQVFRVPMRDASVQASSTGTYPWSISDSSATLVYVKNTSDTPKRFTVLLKFPGGNYSVGVKTVAAGQTLSFDVKQIRDQQTPDSNGNTIPLAVAQGQLHWSIQDAGTEFKALIGRAEQPNDSAGMSTTSACGVCCPDSFQSAWLTPGSVSGVVGGTTVFTGWRYDVDCYYSTLSILNQQERQ